MRARDIFWVSLGCSVLTAMIFMGCWLWYDHEANTGDQRLRQGLDSYDYEQGYVDDRGVEHGAVPESRALSKDYLFLLKIVPASILAVWFVASWLLWGPNAFRLQTLKSHFSALKK